MTTPRSLLRLGFPQIITIIGVVLFLAVINWPHGNVETQILNMSMYLIVMLTVGLLAGWAMIRKPFPRWQTASIVSALMGTWLGGIALGAIQFDGDLGMLLRNPFHNRLNEIEAHRRTQKNGNHDKISLQPERPGDVPGFRGRDRSGVFPEQPIRADWEAKSPQLVWKQPIGEGYGGISAVNGHLITLEQRGDNEVIACYAAQDGREVWTFSYPAAFREAMGGNGPRTTPAVHEGKVYSLGCTGELICLNGEDGSLVWKTNILTETKNLAWGMSGSPLIVDDCVVVNPGGPGAVRGYDCQTGAERWRVGKGRAGYSSPMLAELDGVRQILLFDGDGLTGIDPKTAKELWRFPWDTNQGIHVAQPVIVGNEEIVANFAGSAVVYGTKPALPPARLVFIASGYGVGGALVEVRQIEKDKWSAKQVWRTKAVTMRCKFTTPVRWHGCLIGLNDGILECVNLHDGRSLWKDDRRARRGEAYGHGQLLLVGDDVIVLTEFGEIVRVQARPDELVERGRFQAIDGLKTWSTPTLVDGFLYVRNAEEMACYDLRP